MRKKVFQHSVRKKGVNKRINLFGDFVEKGSTILLKVSKQIKTINYFDCLFFSVEKSISTRQVRVQFFRYQVKQLVAFYMPKSPCLHNQGANGLGWRAFTTSNMGGC